MNVEIIEAARASSYLNDPAFLRSWSELAEACPWATVYQSIDFCRIWYECYANVYAPLLVVGMDSGRLVGLLPLAVEKHENRLVWAGDHHAEYHTWLSNPSSGDQFIESALDALARDFSGGSLTFSFMAPGTPLTWLEPTGRWGRLAASRKVDRPLMRTDPQLVQESLRKKGTRSKLNRLRSMGDLEFKVLQSAEELGAIFDQVMLFKRYRHLSAHGQQRPVSDPQKRAFYLKAMQLGLLHASIVTLDGRLVSAHIGNRNKNEILLGILAHSPFFSAHSPGKLHILLLANQLWKEGVRTFDLTPGGEYKERFASHVDEVRFAVVFFRSRDYLAFKLKRTLADWGKKAALKVRVNPSRLQQRVTMLRGQRNGVRLSALAGLALAAMRHRLWHRAEYRIYRMAPGNTEDLRDATLVRRDSIADLLAFMPGDPWRLDFIQHSLAMIERGAHPYTLVEDGKLIHCGWVEKTSEWTVSEVGQSWRPPEGSIVLSGFYTNPEARGRDLYQMVLCQILRESAAWPGTKYLFIGVLADDMSSREIIERLGFCYEFSFFKSIRLFRSRKWTNAPDSATRPKQPAKS